jgi:hypothetical protein
MTLSNEKRREKYNIDNEYRQKILAKCKRKYYDDEEYRKKKIESAIKYGKMHKIDKVSNNKQYYIDHADHIKNTTISNNRSNRNEVLYWYSNGLMKCDICGELHIEFLCIDHIDDNGASHRRELGPGGGRIYRYLLNNNFPEGYQVLCNNCNYLKEYDRLHSKEYSKQIHANIVRNQRLRIRLQTLYWYSDGLMECECCKEKDIRLLTIDHKNGGGKKEMSKNHYKNVYEYLYYNNYPENGYRVLCWNCNKSHGQYGYCPHQ